MIRLFICLAACLWAMPEVLCVKKFPTATRPPPPPPAPPLVVFDQPTTGQSEPPPQARFEYFELIAPSQNGQNYNPTLSIKNPDFNVVYRPRPQQQTQRPPVQPQRPSVQPQRPPVRPQRPPVQPQRPPVQPQRPPVQPQRPQQPVPPLYQFPQQLQFQQRPQRPNSQVLSRPRSDPLPTPVHRFAPQAFNQLQQPA